MKLKKRKLKYPRLVEGGGILIFLDLFNLEDKIKLNIKTKNMMFRYLMSNIKQKLFN